MKIKFSISANSFLIAFFIYLIISLLFVFCFDKLIIHETLNNFHCAFLDYLFYLITNLGHGLFVILISLLVYIKNKNYGLLIFFSFIISSLLTQGLKHFVFEELMRPSHYINANKLNVPVLDYITLHTYNSFPSGHTTSIFSLCAMLSFFSKKRLLGVFYFIIALLVGFSRIYLSQHFLVDVVVGSIIGVSISMILYLFFVLKKGHNSSI